MTVALDLQVTFLLCASISAADVGSVCYRVLIVHELIYLYININIIYIDIYIFIYMQFTMVIVTDLPLETVDSLPVSYLWLYERGHWLR